MKANDCILRVEKLAKKFGQVEAVRDVSFSVRRKAITAFLGENGAGKTTTIKAILGFLKADRGHVEMRANRVGYIPEHPVFFPWLSGREILTLTARLFGVMPSRLNHEVERMSAVTLFDTKLLARKVQTYSLGNQKKFSYLQSLIISPDFVIVDEPFSSLDPLSIKSVRDLFLSLKAGGKTFFLSSHLISEMEKICDDVIIIKQGRICLEESVERLRREGPLDLEKLFLSFHG
ncbi:MAG: ABC transporter ATP-binding protein [Candidatus Aminicenantes bacterium]|nr:ABC transporter ATP-binding protein [Candidatus Aminicenantes bacterium]